jgi:hypothetical protein
MGDMQTHQRPQLIYILEEIGIQLTFSSGNQNLLTVEGSELVRTATYEKRKNRDCGLWSVVCVGIVEVY